MCFSVLFSLKKKIKKSNIGDTSKEKNLQQNRSLSASSLNSLKTERRKEGSRAFIFFLHTDKTNKVKKKTQVFHDGNSLK